MGIHSLKMGFLTAIIQVKKHSGRNKVKDITLSYKQYGFNHRIASKLPERWDELTPAQLIAVSRNNAGDIPETEMLANFLGIKKNVAVLLDDYQRYCIAIELDFMKDFKPFYSFVIRNIKGLTSPRPRLEGMSFAQFMFMDTYNEIAVVADDSDQLNKFIACLYLPDGKSFDDQLIQDRAEYVELFFLPEEKTAINLNYRLVKEWLCNQYPLIFKKPSDDPDENNLPSNATGDRNRGSNWVKLYESIVGDDIVNQDKYDALPLHTIFRYLTQKIKENGHK
jgi:hypothetical protein